MPQTSRCTGPRTREGKQKSSREALKAGWLQSYATSDPVSLTLVL
jgi:hypothetical protein